nr:hypothetical protein [Tanacetum cinerariifolium]
AKKRKLNEEAQEAKALKKQLEIVNDEDDDVFTEATPLGRKVPVVDYEIVMINNKPRWTRCYMEKSKQCIWSSVGEKLEAADFMWLQVEEESEMSLELLRVKDPFNKGPPHKRSLLPRLSPEAKKKKKD